MPAVHESAGPVNGRDTAEERLSRALVALADRGVRPPCAELLGADLWLSDSHDDRAEAAVWCVGCAVFTECAEAAGEFRPTFGVWAGRDYTRRAGR